MKTRPNQLVQANSKIMKKSIIFSNTFFMRISDKKKYKLTEKWRTFDVCLE